MNEVRDARRRRSLRRLEYVIAVIEQTYSITGSWTDIEWAKK